MRDLHIETEKKIIKDIREKIEFTNKNQYHTTEHLSKIFWLDKRK